VRQGIALAFTSMMIGYYYYFVHEDHTCCMSNRRTQNLKHDDELKLDSETGVECLRKDRIEHGYRERGYEVRSDDQGTTLV